MNSDLLAVLDYMEREKGIKREVLLDAVSSALLTAAKKSVGPARDLRVSIDPKSGEITAHANLFVVESVRNIHDEILLSRARKSARKHHNGKSEAAGNGSGSRIHGFPCGSAGILPHREPSLRRDRSRANFHAVVSPPRTGPAPSRLSSFPPIQCSPATQLHVCLM